MIVVVVVNFSRCFILYTRSYVSLGDNKMCVRVRVGFNVVVHECNECSSFNHVNRKYDFVQFNWDALFLDVERLWMSPFSVRSSRTKVFCFTL